MDLSLLIPAYNEETRILDTVDRARRFLLARPWSWEIVVIDDGSADATATVVEAGRGTRPGLWCERVPRNRGKGAAVRRGLERASGEVVGYIDADDKTDVAALDEVFSLLEEGADVVIGDRTLEASHIDVPRRAYRQWGSQQFRRLLRWWLGLGGLPDTQCGFKFFRAQVLRDLFAKATIDGYMFDVELLCLARRAGLRIERIPVRWRDDPDSRFKPFSGSLRNLRDLARIYRQQT